VDFFYNLGVGKQKQRILGFTGRGEALMHDYSTSLSTEHDADNEICGPKIE